MKVLFFFILFAIGQTSEAETFNGQDFHLFFPDGTMVGKTKDGHACDLDLIVNADNSAYLDIQDQTDPDLKDVDFNARVYDKVTEKSESTNSLHYVVEIPDGDVIPATTTEHLTITRNGETVTVELTNYDIHLNWGYETLTCEFTVTNLSR